MFIHLNRILKNTSLVLGLFREEASDIFNAVLAPSLESAHWLEEQINSTTDTSVEILTFLGYGVGARFPQGHADSPHDAMEFLESVLCQVPDSEAIAWSLAVEEAYHSMMMAEIKHGSPSHISIAHKAGELSLVN
jgi:hypothetical protein